VSQNPDPSARLDPTVRLDATVQAGPLAEAAGRLSRLLPTRPAQPALAAVTVRAGDDGLLLVATDGERSVRLRVPATTHEPGEVVVSRRGLAETTATLDVPEVRLVAEGSRLAVRTPGARFALPRFGATGPAPADVPALAGEVAGAALRAAVVPVAGAASREHALPIFTGVRVRCDAGRLSLLATDRYRLASASLAWRPAGQAGSPGPAVDALVPAAVFAEVARQAGRAETVGVHATGDLFGLTWEGGSVVTATLGDSFPDLQLDRLLQVDPECVVDVETDALAGAVERASRYAGAPGRITVEAGDGVLLVRASDPLTGESQEAVKAAVRGDHVTRLYQARLLADALHAFAGQTMCMGIQAGTRATELRAADEEPAAGLRYLIVPLRFTDEPASTP
jgi:DNA polymerase-3 subunit beta